MARLQAFLANAEFGKALGPRWSTIKGETVMQIDSTLPIMMIPPVESKPESTPPVLLQGNTNARVEQIDHAISELAEAVQPFDVALKFSKDKDTGMIVIQMISQSTGETLHQIPNEAMLNVAAVLGKLQGLIFSKVA